MNYHNHSATDDEVSKETGSQCYGYGTGQSHERIIQSAGGTIEEDGFKDPRPGHDGKIYADRVFIDEKSNNIKAVNFSDGNGKFCCSYHGSSYDNIKEKNKQDLSNKQTQEESKSGREEYDEFGVKKSGGEEQRDDRHMHNGITR